MTGNYLLMMFYTTIAGWMLYYVFRMATGEFEGVSPDVIGAAFNSMRATRSRRLAGCLLRCCWGLAYAHWACKRVLSA